MNRTHILFMHGWGFDRSFWAPLGRELSGIACTTLDMGFFGPPEIDLAPPDAPVVAVGHSLGFAWLTRQPALRATAWVSLGGFASFARGPDAPHGAPVAAVRAMRRGLARDAGAVLEAFYASCGLPAAPLQAAAAASPGTGPGAWPGAAQDAGPGAWPVATADAVPSATPCVPPDTGRATALSAQALAVPDTGRADAPRLTQGLDDLLAWRAAPQAPLYALAAKDDAVVSPAHTLDCFNGQAHVLHFLEDGGHAFPLTRPAQVAAFLRAVLDRHA